MISAKLTTNTQPLDDLIGFLDSFNEVITEIGDEVAAEIEPQLLDELQTQPGAPKYPIEWTSEKQRRAFFASNGFGGGIPYKRTGKLAAGWQVVGQTTNGRFTLSVVNPSKAAQYVYGTLNFRSLSEALAPKQKMHTNTGWQTASETVRFWFDAAQERFDERLTERLAEFGGTRKTTRRSRRR